MKQIFLGLGSNLENPILNLKKALIEIQSVKEIFNFKVSSFYQTSPISNVPQPDFVNAVCCFETSLLPHFLFSILCQIEKKLGKKDKPKNAPRILDIDLLLYGEVYLNETELTLPHPRMLERLFVLQPLSELTQEINFPHKRGGAKKLNLKNLIRKHQRDAFQKVEKVSLKPALLSRF